ncbi:MAG TPA: hypothetical protein VE967_17055 [Gemmatimonadaceae bacterium]|nr:hypothetical protein [Gemmatimonadaceae bacterium]
MFLLRTARTELANVNARLLFVATIFLATPLAAQGGAKTQAQSVAGNPPVRLLDSRQALTAAARAAESQHRTAEVAAINTRLQRGDFNEGDRIVVAIVPLGNPAALAAAPQGDTLVVQPGRVVIFPRVTIGPLQLAGVLRSELTSAIQRHFLGALYRDTSAFAVRATSLIAVSITGRVLRSNFFSVSPENKLSDLIIIAGGYAADANTDKVLVRRGTTTIIDEVATRRALTDGTTVDQLYMREGDEVFVARRSERNILSYIQISLALLSVAIGLSNRH